MSEYIIFKDFLNSAIYLYKQTETDNFYLSVYLFLKRVILLSKDVIKIKFFPDKKNVELISNNKICIDYKFSGKNYKFLSAIKRGPKNHTIEFFDDNNENITDRVIPFYGPNCDWHKIQYCPNDFLLNELNVKLSNENYNFKKMDIINF